MNPRKQTLYESMVDTIEEWMNDWVVMDADGVGYHNSKKARDELESLLIRFAEDVLRDEAITYVQEIGGRPE
jgi:hypothetical protein